MSSFPLAEILSGKTVLLRSANNVSETIRSGRFLREFCGAGTAIIVEDLHGLGDVFKMFDANVIVADPNETANHAYDIEYDLNKLQFFSKENRSDASLLPYLTIPPRLARHARNHIGDDRRGKVGLCLDQPAGATPVKITDIAHNLTIQQTVNWDYFSFVATKDDGSNNTTRLSYAEVGSRDCGYAVTAALLAEMDMVISFDNAIAHLAGALAKPIFLLVPYGATENAVSRFVHSYPLVTVFRQQRPDDWGHLFLEISLLTRFKPELPRFEPFDLQGTIVSNVDCRPFPSLVIESVDDLPKLLDVDTGILANVFIETTSICNLSCPYCPNSTVGRDQEFMAEETFYRIIDSLKEYDSNYTGLIAPHFYGEPLIDMRMESFVSYIRKVHPLSVIEIYTNGELLSAERYKSLKLAGVNTFNVSQHTAAPSKALLDTLRYIQVNSLPAEDLKCSDMTKQSVKFNRGGLVDVQSFSDETLRMAGNCIAAHRVMLFDYKGNAVICCNDYLSKHSYGNINDRRLGDIWNDRTYRRTRNLVLYGYLPLHMCRTCMYG